MKFLNEKMTLSFEQFEDKCHRIASSVSNGINKYLDTYGFEVEYIPEYEDFLDEMENCVGLFLASTQDNVSVFPMTLNIPFLFDYFSEDGYIGAELDWAIESTMWHEAGHGIVAYLSDFYDFDWDEEEVVEEFARCMCDGVEQCELVDALEDYTNDTFEESYTTPNLKLEALTTKTVRRDNPSDFSPFGYKVDFYDGDNHIGEGSVCGVKADNAFLYDFEVYPEFRGKGYSKEMLQFLIDKYDLKQLFVKPDNTIAINLYKKYGFEFDDGNYDPDDIGNMRLMIRESYKMRFKLTEGKNLEQTVQQYIDKYQKILPLDDDQQYLHRNQVMGLIEIDPTYKKGSNTTGDYAIWILNLAIKNNWDVLKTKDKVQELLIDFIDKKSLLKNKDINSYKTPEDLAKALSGVELTDRQKERRARNATAMTKKVLSTENFDIYMALNWEGALTLGKGTHWCTADSENAGWYVKYIMDYWHDENVEAFEVKDCEKEHHITIQELIDYPKFLYGEYEGEYEVKSEEEIYAQYSDRAVFVDVQGEGFFVNPYNKLDDNNPPYNRLFVFIDKRDGSKYQFCMSEELSEYEEDLEYALTFCDSKDRALDFRDFIGYRNKDLRQFWEEVMGYSLQELFAVDPDAEDDDLDESLNEGIEDMKKFYPNIPDDKFQSYIELDPTYKQGSTQAGKYAKWILGLANQGKLDNLGHIKDLLTRFHSEKNRLKNKDIMKYKSMEELDSALSSEDSYSELSDRQKLRQTQKAVHNVDLGEDAELLYSDSDWEVWTPKTYEASCKLGRGTRWCTASTEDDYYFNYYTDRGPLYINIDKRTGKKYQLHFETESFMDENDDEISLAKLFSENEKLFDVYASFSDPDFVDEMQYKLKRMKEFITKLKSNGGVFVIDGEDADDTYSGYSESSMMNDDDIVSLITEVLIKNVDYPQTRFIKFPNLRKVTIGEGVTRIRTRQFADCDKLTTVIIEDGVTTIGEEAFKTCSELVDVRLPSTLETIKSGAFQLCASLEHIEIPESVTSIYNSAFRGCVRLKNATIPSSVTFVGENLFRGDYNLTEVNYFARTTIPKHCFGACYSLSKITIGDGVNCVENDAFYFCNGLTKITLPESLTVIYDDAFNGCHKLRDIKISSSTKECYSSSFPVGATVVSDTYNKYVADMLEDTGIFYTSLDRKQESLQEDLLEEDIAAVKKNFPMIDDDTFMRLIALDPTYNPDRDSVGNYGKWILTLYKKGEIKEDDFENVSQMLDVWETNKKRFTNKDIGQFKTLKQLEDALLDMPDLELSHRQKVRQNQKARKYADLGNEAELVLDGAEWWVYIPKTFAASCKLGQGTTWCTATTESDSYYRKYTSDGPLYILIRKSNEDEKYQLHFESGQFMDYDDTEIDLLSLLRGSQELATLFYPILFDSWGINKNAKFGDTIEVVLTKRQIRECLKQVTGSSLYLDGDTAYELIYDTENYLEDYFYDDYYAEMMNEAISYVDDRNYALMEKLGVTKDNLQQTLFNQDTKLWDAFIEAIRNAMMDSAVTDAYTDAVIALEESASEYKGVSGVFYESDGELVVTGELKAMMDFYERYFETETFDTDWFTPLENAVGNCITSNFRLFNPSNGWGVLEEEEFNDALTESLKSWYTEELV